MEKRPKHDVKSSLFCVVAGRQYFCFYCECKQNKDDDVDGAFLAPKINGRFDV